MQCMCACDAVWFLQYYGLCIASFVSSLTSETRGSFTNQASTLPALTASTGSGQQGSQGDTHVFCRGDYDFPLNTPLDHFLSVKQRDYPALSSLRPSEKGYSICALKLDNKEWCVWNKHVQLMQTCALKHNNHAHAHAHTDTLMHAVVIPPINRIVYYIVIIFALSVSVVFF